MKNFYPHVNFNSGVEIILKLGNFTNFSKQNKKNLNLGNRLYNKKNIYPIKNK